jgi:hypothetical protein
VGNSGTTLEAHLRQVAATEGVELEDLYETTPCPAPMEYLWDVYQELHFGRQVGFGPGPLTYEGISAWCWLNGVKLSPWELGTVKAVDALYLTEVTKRGSRKPNPAGE